jgi:short subunit dehydrogenase-like uncharacterized protein
VHAREQKETLNTAQQAREKHREVTRCHIVEKRRREEHGHSAHRADSDFPLLLWPRRAPNNRFRITVRLRYRRVVELSLICLMSAATKRDNLRRLLPGQQEIALDKRPYRRYEIMGRDLSSFATIRPLSVNTGFNRMLAGQSFPVKVWNRTSYQG